MSEPEQRGWPQKKLYLMAQIKSSELWRRVKIPVLALYGGKDLNVPAAKNVTALIAELTAAGNRDFTIEVFRDATMMDSKPPIQCWMVNKCAFSNNSPLA